MKQIIYGFLAMVLISCNSYLGKKESKNDIPGVNPQTHDTFELILPDSLESRRSVFKNCVNSAIGNIEKFVVRNGWSKIKEEVYFDTVKIFDDKRKFDVALLRIVGEDTSMALPETYCAALENRNLLSVTPEYYAHVYPEGIEEKSFEKLLTHEIAHRLHIRILNGAEENMGPIWFYEGFAMFVADQFSTSELTLNNDEMIEIMKDPQRGSYMKYNYIFRYFVKLVSLDELIAKAKHENFNDKLISMLK